jgi:DNA ligase (NAD+)
LSAPTVDDSVFDKHLHELIKLEEENPEFILKDSPTQKVGGTASSNFEKREHAFRPMLSLSNAFNNEDLIKFDKRVRESLDLESVEYTVEPKIDGISISLHYKDGKFFEAITRGDGKVGEIVTDNISRIKSIPKEISIKEEINFRGEVFMPNSKFEEINNKRSLEGVELFANPRNATSGTVRQLNPDVVEERGLDIFIYFAYKLDGNA